MSDAPSQWPIEPLSELGQWVGGGTPSKDRPDYWTGGTIPWVSPKDMKVPVLHTAEDRITELAVAESSTRVVPAPSVFLVTRSGILSRTLPVAVTAVDAALNQDLKALVPREGVNPHFVAYALKSAEREILRECSKHGTTVASIDLDRLLRVTIPVPPESEQAEVVAQLDSQLSRLAVASSTLERVRTNLKRYQASVLQAAVTGRLVPTEASLARAEGRSFEPASDLLARILEERRSGWKASGKRGKYNEPIAPDTESLSELPEGWCWASLDQLSRVVRNGYSPAPTATSGTRVLRISAVRSMSVDVNDVRFTSDPPAKFKDAIVHAGDLLFTRYNGNPAFVGVCGRIREGSSVPLVHPDKLIRVELVPDGTISAFVEVAVNTGHSRRALELATRTTAGQAGISGRDLRRVPVPVAPLVEQVRIAEEVSRCLVAIRGAEETIRSSLARLGTLRRGILQSAFRGELV